MRRTPYRAVNVCLLCLSETVATVTLGHTVISVILNNIAATVPNCFCCLADVTGRDVA